tara:strand:- start:246 stop:551 length:306 start_codon:yes stop_codon:yes gene_type:complete
MKQIQQNKLMGRLAEVYSKHDVRNNGFTVISSRGVGYDFLAVKISRNYSMVWFVEVKFNQSRLSKPQRKFMHLCKKLGMNYLVYRVSPAQLHLWIAERSGL